MEYPATHYIYMIHMEISYNTLHLHDTHGNNNTLHLHDTHGNILQHIIST